MIDPSGLEVGVAQTTLIDIPTTAPLVLSLTTPFKPISDAISAGSRLTNQRVYGPTGTFFNDVDTSTGLNCTFHYALEDLVVDGEGVIDENSLRVLIYNTLTGMYEENSAKVLQQSLDTNAKKIDFHLKGFSNYGVGGTVIPKPEQTAVDSALWDSHE